MHTPGVDGRTRDTARVDEPAPGPQARRVVALVSFAEILGGAERSLLALAEQLPACGWDPVLVCPEGGLAGAAAERGLRVELVTLRRTRPVSEKSGGRKTYAAAAVRARAVGTLVNARAVARVLRAVDPDLVHSNSMQSHLGVALAGRAVRRPVILHLREIIEAGPGRTVLVAVGRLTSGMVAISAAVAAAAGHRNMHVVHNPVPAPPPDLVPTEWGVGRPVVGYLGRLDPRKGIEDLIEAAGLVDGVHVVVVGAAWSGTPDYVASLQASAAALAPGRVHFVGSVQDPWPAVAGLDVLVVPSLAEPFGRVAAEGQRAGVAVLAADAGGLPEIVTDMHDGMLFTAREPAALAERLARLVADPGLRARLGAAGRASSARFDPRRHALAMADVYRQHARARQEASR